VHLSALYRMFCIEQVKQGKQLHID